MTEVEAFCTVRECPAVLWAFLEASENALIRSDLDGLITSWSPGAARLYGYTREEAVGSSIEAVVFDDRQSEFRSLVQRVQAGTSVLKREMLGKTKSGMRVNVSLSIAPILDDECCTVAVLTIARDLTALRRAAAEGIDGMASVVAHQFRNGLAAVRGTVQVLGRRFPDESQEMMAAHEAVTRIDALATVVKDMMLFANPPEPKQELVRIGDIVRSAASLALNDPALAGVTLELAGTIPTILGDADLLRAAFQHLFTNSVQAMDGTGTIRVLIGETSTSCRIEISDEGPGISSDVLARLFTPFVTTKARGSGLGLAIVKQIVGAHDGAVRIECPPAGGTKVVVDLPAIARRD